MNQPQAQPLPQTASPGGYGNPHEGQGYQNLPAPEAPAMSHPLQPQPAPISELPPFDLSPGEPAAYIVPPAYRRPFGEAPRDKRGRAWTLAFGAMASGITSVLIIFTPFGLYGFHGFAALAGIILGIIALVRNARSPRTQLSKKITLYAWSGILGGVLCLAISALAVWALMIFLEQLFLSLDVY